MGINADLTDDKTRRWGGGVWYWEIEIFKTTN